MSKELAQRFELGPDAQGVVITDVKGDSSAVEKGIRPGDVILEVNMEKVGKPADVTAQVEEARKAGRRRSEEHTSELQSLMRRSYAVFRLKKKKKTKKQQ